MLPFWDEVSKSFYRSLGVSRGTRLLDVGAGRGTLVRLARAEGIDAFGIDPYWPDPIDAHVKVGYAEAIPFPDMSFDVVTCFSVMESVNDPTVTMAEIGRVLRPDGKAVIAVPELEAYPKLRRDRYQHITSRRWFREVLDRTPQLQVRSVHGFGVRFVVPIARRTVVRALPRLAPRPLAKAYARAYPFFLSDLTIWTLSR